MSVTDDKSDLKSRRNQYALPFIADSAQNPPFPARFSPANEQARKLLDAWCENISKEPGHGIVVTGPEASGKSFLVRWIAARFDVQVTPGTRLGDVLSAPGDGPVVVIDDVEKVREPGLLTRFIDVSQERGLSFILTGTGKPESWAVTNEGPLTDLLTRLAALPEASLDSPDETLMVQVLRDWLKARQLVVSSDLAAFAVARLKRSFRCLEVFVEHLDAEALQRQKAIDKALIQLVLASLPEHTLS